MFHIIKKLTGVRHSRSCCNKETDSSKQASKSAKYSVYIYYPSTNKNRGSQWRKVGATNCKKHAVEQALTLHKKQKYQSIEIKRCSYLKKKHLETCKTIRVYNKKSSSPLEKCLRSLSIPS